MQEVKADECTDVVPEFHVQDPRLENAMEDFKNAPNERIALKAIVDTANSTNLCDWGGTQSQSPVLSRRPMKCLPEHLF